ncbi:uncharacterized protein TNCV_1686111 [Trichonephila clavipes]|nr:uncharacterized protein TNCV_1686111 [Trichonephila clavipes]
MKEVPFPSSHPDNPDFEKVRDHDHLIDPLKFESNYRGTAHNLCNLIYQNSSFVPVFIHNLSGYDSHLYIRELGGDDGNIDVIPTMKRSTFLSVKRSMASSLDNLAKNVKEFRETSKYFPKDKLNLVTRKGVYPNDYKDSWQKCDETKLPRQKDFYNKMNESNISLGDYKHAKNVWNAFNIKTLGEYSDLYVKTDCSWLILLNILGMSV